MEQLLLISVIVPVYKVEDYLDQCVSSIVNQSYSNLEIILVDDGSPDRSGIICDEWATRDSRIRVIHQANAGSGAARNVALDIAGGDLLAFVDSDDYIAQDMFEHLYRLMMRGADITECGYMNVFDDLASFPPADPDVRTYTVQEAMAEHIRDRIFCQLIWNKLYRREVIGSIRFPIDKRIDDEFFTYQVLGNAKTLIRSKKIAYAYRQQMSSVMHSMGAQKRLQSVEAKVQRHSYIEKNFPDLIDLSVNNLWFTCIYLGQLTLRETDLAHARQTLKYLCNVLQEHPIKLTNTTLKDRFWLSLAHMSIEMACRIRNLLRIGI